MDFHQIFLFLILAKMLMDSLHSNSWPWAILDSPGPKSKAWLIIAKGCSYVATLYRLKFFCWCSLLNYLMYFLYSLFFLFQNAPLSFPFKLFLISSYSFPLDWLYLISIRKIPLLTVLKAFTIVLPHQIFVNG